MAGTVPDNKHIMVGTLDMHIPLFMECAAYEDSKCPSLLATCIHISPLSWISFPCRSPQSAEKCSLCCTVGSQYLCILYIVVYIWGFPGGLVVKNPPAMRETWVSSLGWEDPLEKQMATHPGIRAWRIP